MNGDYYPSKEQFASELIQRKCKQAIQEFADKLVANLLDEAREQSAAYIVQDYNHFFAGVSHGFSLATEVIEKTLDEIYGKE